MDIDNWLNIIIQQLKENFSDKLLFIGLQGSYNRGEATADSDIDLVVILDKLDFESLKIYRSIIGTMPNKDKACGFISGKNELQKWSKSDLFQFYYDTTPLLGNLENIIQLPQKEDIKILIKISAENIYHSAVHSFVHSNSYTQDLKNLYKMTFFILQAKYFVETNNYIPTKKQLLNRLSGFDREILNVCINKDNISNMDSEILYKNLITWSVDNI